MMELSGEICEWSYLEMLLFACLGMAIYVAGYFAGFYPMENNATRNIKDKISGLEERDTNDLNNIQQILLEWKLDIRDDPSKVVSLNTIKQMARHYGLDKSIGSYLYNPPESATRKDER